MDLVLFMQLVTIVIAVFIINYIIGLKKELQLMKRKLDDVKKQTEEIAHSVEKGEQTEEMPIVMVATEKAAPAEEADFSPSRWSRTPHPEFEKEDQADHLPPPSSTERVSDQQEFAYNATDNEEAIEVAADPLNEIDADDAIPLTSVAACDAPAIPTRKRKKKVNYEKYIGENLFGKIGILIFVIGVGLFVSYAIDRNWINETWRTVLGFLTGSILLAVAERLEKKYRTFSSLLAGGAFAIFYLTVAIAFHYYHLFSQTAAFIILVGVTLFMSVLSVLYNRRELAIIALVGGFIAPFIVSTNSGDYVMLFTYITILNVGAFGLSIYKRWKELIVISFLFTLLISVIFLLTGYSVVLPYMSVVLSIFATIFYFIYLLSIVSFLITNKLKRDVGLTLMLIANNFIYLLIGLLFLSNIPLSFDANGIFCLFIAIINLLVLIWLRKNKADYKLLMHIMLGLVLTFVSITIPLQAGGIYITLLWSSETTCSSVLPFMRASVCAKKLDNNN